METDLTTSWTRIESWLQANAKRIARRLKPPATDDDIAKAETKLGVRLPDDVHAVYHIHNGAPESDLLPSSHPQNMGYSLHALKDIPKHWRPRSCEDAGCSPADIKADVGVRAEYWHPSWIPIAGDGSGDYLCIDLAPAEGGVSGQVIQLSHESLTRRLRAPSLALFLAELADGLEQGKYAYDPEDGIVNLGSDRAPTVDELKSDPAFKHVMTTKSGAEYYARLTTLAEAVPPTVWKVKHEYEGTEYVWAYFVVKDGKLTPNSSALDTMCKRAREMKW